MNDRLRRLEAATALGLVAMALSMATMIYAALNGDIIEAACFGLLATAGHATSDRASRSYAEEREKSRGGTIPP